jgi:hypothetical protein
MAGTVDKKLSELDRSSHPGNPVANYIPFVRVGALLFVSGQICLDGGGKLVAKGKLGAGVSLEDGQKRRAPARSMCWRRSRRRSAISTRSSRWSGSAASSIRPGLRRS